MKYRLVLGDGTVSDRCSQGRDGDKSPLLANDGARWLWDVQPTFDPETEFLETDISHIDDRFIRYIVRKKDENI